MVEKGIRGGIFQAIHQYAKTNNKYIKDYDKSKKSSNFKNWDVNSLYDWAISLKLSLNNFEWIKDNSTFHEDFIKSFYKESDEGYFLEGMFNMLENYMAFIKIYHFYMKEWKWKNRKAFSKKVYRVIKFNQKAYG